jgi:hypothetical protein
MHWVKKVKYLDHYRLELTFNDKVKKVVNLEYIANRKDNIFSPLRDIEFFKQVTLDDGPTSICWPNGADICPDVLYDLKDDR